MSGYSVPTSRATPPVVKTLATVGLVVTAPSRDIHAALVFANVSSQTVYLDKVSACAGHKIGDDVFRIFADDQPVPFTGQKSKRRKDPGDGQFIVLKPGEKSLQDVTLSDSYRFPSGSHHYSITYTAPHNYPARAQGIILTSKPVPLDMVR